MVFTMKLSSPDLFPNHPTHLHCVSISVCRTTLLCPSRLKGVECSHTPPALLGPCHCPFYPRSSALATSHLLPQPHGLLHTFRTEFLLASLWLNNRRLSKLSTFPLPTHLTPTARFKNRPKGQPMSPHFRHDKHSMVLPQ